jgi:hypothetical protein
MCGIILWQSQEQVAIVKVFISWSGQLSKAIAESLYSWLPQAIQSLIPWMSAQDVSAGTRWSSTTATELETAHFGIICVTPDNVNAPWLQFEAGALSKTLVNTFVCPYLFGLHPTELKGPLAQFQAVRADREGTHHLLRTLNIAAGQNSLSTSQLDKAFQVWWPRLQKGLATIATSLNSVYASTQDDNAVLKEILERIRNLTPRPIVELYFLVSFAPSTGVGVYEYAGTKHRFAAVPGARNSEKKSPLEGQVAAGYYFSSLEKLFAFCKREYLAARKGAYYSTLFTKPMNRRQSTKALQFLNQESLSGINISPVVVSALKEIVDVERVAETVLRAHELKLDNVKACLSAELGEIVLAGSIFDVLKTTPAGAAAIAAILGAKGNPIAKAVDHE